MKLPKLWFYTIIHGKLQSYIEICSYGTVTMVTVGLSLCGSHCGLVEMVPSPWASHYWLVSIGLLLSTLSSVLCGPSSMVMLVRSLCDGRFVS